ncbi:MAG: sodium:solute symporter family transporter [Eubacteriales bacterium]
MQNIIYITILVIYLLAMIFIGVIGMKKSQTFTDFTIGGRNISGAFIGLTLMASFYSASTYMGVPALAFKFGWPAFWVWVGAHSGVIAIIIAGKRTRIQGEILDSRSFSDFIGGRYQSNLLRLILALATIVFFVPAMIGQFKGAGLLFHAITNQPYAYGVIISAIVVAGYCALGGMHAGILTDVAQSLMMVLGTLLLLPVVISLAGGLSNINAQLATQDVRLVGVFYPPTFSVSESVLSAPYWIMAFMCLPYLANKYLTLKESGNYSFLRVALYFAVASIFASALTITGLAGRVLNPGLNEPDFVIPSLASTNLSPIIAGIFLVAVFSAIMSSVSGILLAGSYAVANDIYKRILSKDEQKESIDRTAMLIARVSIVAFCFIPMIFALVSPPKFLSLLIYISFGGITSASFAPYLLGLYWRHGTAAGAISSSIVGLVTFLILLLGLKWGTFTSTCVATSLSVLIMILVSRFTNRLPEEFIQQLFSARIMQTKALTHSK